MDPSTQPTPSAASPPEGQPATQEPAAPAAPEDSSAADGDGNGNQTLLIRVGTIVVVALVAGFIAWIVVDRSDDDATTPTTPATTTPATEGPAPVATSVGPIAVSAARLSTLAAEAGHPAYWAGPIVGQRYEYTRTTADYIYVRYLPNGVDAGDPRADFLIIATYPFPDAYKALKKVSAGSEVKIPGGGIALVSKGYPQSVHFAFPGTAYQGEVYAPSPERALQVATSGDVRPIP